MVLKKPIHKILPHKCYRIYRKYKRKISLATSQMRDWRVLELQERLEIQGKGEAF